jgi:hypothetical protein
VTRHISALIQTLIIYLVMGAAYYGWGRVATYVLGMGQQTNRFDITLIWLGWAFTLFIFQLSHFLFPITAYVVAPVFIIGAVCSIPQIVNARWSRPPQISTLLRTAPIIIIMLAGATWIASRSMMSPTNYDSGLYHLKAIHWINSLPIVPGLGNLDGRLAFNQSFFTYVAALNFYPLLGHGRSLANSFLLLLTIVSFAQFLRPVLKRPSLLAESHPFQYSSVLFAFPILGLVSILGSVALEIDGLASPTPDLASTLLQLTMFVMLAQVIAARIKGKGRQDHRATVLAILAATAITIKLTNLAFSAVIVSMCLAFSWRTSGGRIRDILRILVPASLVILVWSVRGFILSGYPLYPSTIGHVSVDWAVPIKEVVDVQYMVYAIVLEGHHVTDLQKILSRGEWFGPWIGRMSKEIVDVVYPLVLGVVFCIMAVISLWLSFFKKRAWPRWLEWAILLPVVIDFIYWFFTAPDPRYAHALFWCLSLSSVLLFLCAIQPLLKKRTWVVVMCVVFIIANLHFIGAAVKRRNTIKEVSSSGWHPIKTVPLIQKKTLSGLVVFTPEQGKQCWDSPLLCTTPNRFNPDLRLRIPGKLASGFTVTMSQKNTEQGAGLDWASTTLHPRQ